MSQLRVRNLSRGTMLAEAANIADSSRARRTGLLKHSSLEPGQGLWIVPCEAVHSFGMKFAIDVVFLNRQRKVVKIRRNMGRRGIAICFRAHSVLELPAGAAAATATEIGDRLEMERYEE